MGKDREDVAAGLDGSGAGATETVTQSDPFDGAQGGSRLGLVLDPETAKSVAEEIARVQYGCGAEEVEARQAEWARTRGGKREAGV